MRNKVLSQKDLNLTSRIRSLFHYETVVDCVWNVMEHAQKPDFVFRRNGRVHLNRRRRQFSRLLVAEVCASAVVMLDTPCFQVVWRVLATHSIRQFLLHLPYRASPCAITFRTQYSTFSALQANIKCATWIVMRNGLLALAVVKVIQSVVTSPSVTEQGSAQVDAVPFTVCELVTPAFWGFFSVNFVCTSV
jgi:hypothetical protein